MLFMFQSSLLCYIVCSLQPCDHLLERADLLYVVIYCVLVTVQYGVLGQVLLVLTCCLLLFPLWESVIVLCFVAPSSFAIILMGKSWLACLVCLLGVSRLLCGSSSRYRGCMSAVCDCGIS